MISAKESRKKVEENLKNGLTEELQKVEKLINKAIAEGQLQVFVDGTLKTETENQLKELGYKIKVGGRYNEIDTVIKW